MLTSDDPRQMPVRSPRVAWGDQPRGSNNPGSKNALLSFFTGHFTQVVWKKSEKLGVGKAEKSDASGSRIVVVANYSPAGNYTGQFAENVLPEISSVGSRKSSTSSSSSSSSDESDQDNKSDRIPRKEAGAGGSSGKSSAQDDMSADEGSSAKPVKLSDHDVAFVKELVKHHNRYRKLHGSPNIRMSTKLTKYAKEWADKLASEGSLRHRTEFKFGENLYMKWSTDPKFVVKPKDAADHWYNEISNYKNWDTEPRMFDGTSGHFSQMIWRGTRYVGAAVGKTKDGKVFVVANYYPPGNFLGSFTKNVRPPKEKKK